ncbi:MAG: hypothetical protein R3358_06780 [Woeseiaceae bacterium]|nr:hypothetical protein [Woeseiaceae bacterium]
MFARLNNRSGAGLGVELLMIIVGINVALWFEGWFEDLREREAEQQYLGDLLDDLDSDLEQLEVVIASNDRKAERLRTIVETYNDLPSADPQVQARAIFAPSSYNFFTPADVTYQSLLESGDFRLISDPDVKKGLLRLSRLWDSIETLQNNFLQALDDGYIPRMMDSFDIVEMKMTDPSLYEDQTFKNFFAYSLQDTAAMLSAYERAAEETRIVRAAIAQSLDN